MKGSKEDNSFYMQTQGGDREIMLAAKRLKYGDADTDTIVSKYVSPKNRDNYTVLRDSGMHYGDAIDMLLEVDALGNSNGSIAQQELVDYYFEHPDQEAYVAALWNAQGYTKKGQPNLWDPKKAKRSKK